MKLQQPYKCDYCDNVKGEANHWWLRFVFIDNKNPDSSLSNNFSLRPWNEASAESPNFEHVCSEQCATKALARWMAEVRGVSTITKAQIAAGYITTTPLWKAEPETAGPMCNLDEAGVCKVCGLSGGQR